MLISVNYAECSNMDFLCIRIMANSLPKTFINAVLKQPKIMISTSKLHKPFCTKPYVMNICGNNSSTVERKTSTRVTREREWMGRRNGEKAKADERTSDSTFTNVPITLGAEKQFKLFVFY